MRFMITPEELMQLAVEKCREGIVAGQSPFGCAIAQGDKVIAVAHNTVLKTTDITAHAEIVAIREACTAIDAIHLEDALVATTCEPCPMCMAALHWARVREVHFGATIQDADDAGFNELSLAAADLLSQGGSAVQLVSGTGASACRDLFAFWKEQPGRRAY